MAPLDRKSFNCKCNTVTSVMVDDEYVEEELTIDDGSPQTPDTPPTPVTPSPVVSPISNEKTPLTRYVDEIRIENLDKIRRRLFENSDEDSD